MWLLTGDTGAIRSKIYDGKNTNFKFDKIDERRDLGTQRSSPPDDRSKRGVYGGQRDK